MAVKKSAAQTDAFAFPSFDPAKMTDGYRDYAEKTLEQSKEAYSKMKTMAEDTSKTIETTMQNAQAGTVEVGLKAIDAVRSTVDASLHHMEALLGVKSVAELIELQTAYVRKQTELSADHAKLMQEAARSAIENVAKPAKTAVEKAAQEFKSA